MSSFDENMTTAAKGLPTQAVLDLGLLAGALCRTHADNDVRSFYLDALLRLTDHIPRAGADSEPHTQIDLDDELDSEEDTAAANGQSL